MTAVTDSGAASVDGQLQRTIDWRGAFWVASGVPPLVLFSIGGVAGTAGNVAFLIWIGSMMMGFLQSFTYAEIAGLFPNKSGGSSVYGATAWVRYSKLIAPLSVWCNWIAWSPVLSLGCTIAAAYMLNAVAPIPFFTESSPEVLSYIAANLGVSGVDAVAAVTAEATPAIRTWTLYSQNLGPVGISLNATFWIGVVLMLTTFSIQHRGILGTASVQRIVALLVIIPLLIIGFVPLFTGQVDWANYSPIVPLSGEWNISGWTLVFGGMFIAAWSTYAFETAVCYTREFKNPETDTFKAIFYSGLLCMVIFTVVPFTFQGFLGLEGMISPGIADGDGVADAMARMVGGGFIIHTLLVMMMILALMLSIMTAMAGSSRTLYQGSVDGWLPRFLGRVNDHGAPVNAMWADLIVNLGVLAIAATDATSFFFILAVSNCGYVIFNFLNLNSGWIHRIDNAHLKRPFRAPTVLIFIGGLLAYVNAMFMGAGAKVWNPVALWAGLFTAALIIPVFCYRHYIQDRGKFPAHVMVDLGLDPNAKMERKAGILPYLTLIAGISVVLLANWFFVL